jgi:hypothetical protein
LPSDTTYISSNLGNPASRINSFIRLFISPPVLLGFLAHQAKKAKANQENRHASNLALLTGSCFGCGRLCTALEVARVIDKCGMLRS